MVRTQEIGKALVWLYGHYRCRASFKQPMRCGPGACSYLENRSVTAQAAAGGENLKYPFRIFRPRDMVARGVLPESLTAELLAEFVCFQVHPLTTHKCGKCSWRVQFDGARLQYKKGYHACWRARPDRRRKGMSGENPPSDHTYIA